MFICVCMHIPIYIYMYVFIYLLRGRTCDETRLSLARSLRPGAADISHIY